MSAPQYSNYAGVGETNSDLLHYSQATRVGPVIETSGQGGWDSQTGEIEADIGKQINTAFANVALALKAAGGEGWAQVYRVRSYHLGLDQETLDHMTRNFKAWMPDHKSIWTCVQVTGLADPGMKVEIEVAAYAP